MNKVLSPETADKLTRLLNEAKGADVTLPQARASKQTAFIRIGDFYGWINGLPFWKGTIRILNTLTMSWDSYSQCLVTEESRKSLTPTRSVHGIRGGDHNGYPVFSCATPCCGNQLSSSGS